MNPTHFSIATRVVKPPIAGSSLLLGRAAPWAAARPRAVRAASFARRVDSLSGQALPPPTGTAARPPRARLVTTSATKLALLASINAQARKNSPNTGKTAQNQALFASRANFFAAPPRIQSRWASFSRRRDPQPPQNTHRPPRLKPMTPMRVDHCHEMKPLTPLLPQNSQFQAIFHPQRRRRFHQMPNQGFWFSARHSDAHACCLRHNPGSVGA